MSAMSNAFSTAKSFIKPLARPFVLAKGKAKLMEWKKAYQIQQDYEALSEMARYVDQQIDGLPESEKSRFFSLGRKSVINDPVFSQFETFLAEGFPETFKDCLEKISDEDFFVFQEYLASRMENKLDLKNLHYMSFSGGGSKGFIYPGVLDVMDEMDIYSNLKEVSGASAGALTALPVALGLSSEDVKRIVTDNRFENFFDESIASAEGFKGLLVGVAKKLKGDLRRKLASVDYLDVFTRELNREIIKYSAEFLAENEILGSGRKSTTEEIESKKEEVKTLFRTMTHHQMVEFIEELNLTAPVDDWIEKATEIANNKVQDKFFNKHLTSAFPEFEGFSSSEEASSFSLRRFSGKDKIEEFMGDVIEDALSKVPERDLERVLPSMTIQADRMLLRNTSIILSLINSQGAPRMSDAGYPINQSEGWRDALDQMMNQNSKNAHGVWSESKGYHWDDILKDARQHGINDQDLNVTLSAIRELDNHSFIQALNATRVPNPDHMKIGENQLKHMLSNWAFNSQRRHYKRNINFYELSKLCDQLPEHGFKKLHITMCRVNGKASLVDMATKREEYFSDRYTLARGSHTDDEYSRMPIKTSARISMNLPVGFDKIKYYGKTYIDGGVVNNSPKDFFIGKRPHSENRTLSLHLGDKSFYEKGRNIKSAIKGNSYSWIDVGNIATNPLNIGLMHIQKAINWGLYKLNPNYEKINNDDLWRSMLLNTGDVGTIDFGISKKEKIDLIEGSKEEVRDFFNNQGDVQLSFLNDRLNTLENWFKENHIEAPTKNPYVENILKPGVFSKGNMGKLHREMASTKSMEKHLDRNKTALDKGSQGMSL